MSVDIHRHLNRVVPHLLLHISQRLPLLNQERSKGVAELREMTNRLESCERSEVRSSVNPSLVLWSDLA